VAYNTEQRKENQRRRRKILITALGGVCVDCGQDDPDLLEFDHTEPRTWVASEQNQMHRQTLYEKDWEAGVLELRCKECNQRKGEPTSNLDPWDDVPF